MLHICVMCICNLQYHILICAKNKFINKHGHSWADKMRIKNPVVFKIHLNRLYCIGFVLKLYILCNITSQNLNYSSTLLI